MKTTFRKLASAVGFASAMAAASAAQAGPIFIDVGAGIDGDFDGDSVTTDFNFFTSSQLRPTSIYYDTDMSGGVSTGDLVVDLAIGMIGQLNPLGSGSSQEGFGLPDNFPTSWDIEVDYVLVGFAVVASGGDNTLDPGETLVGNFIGGTVGLDYVENGALGATTPGPGYEVEVEVTGSNIIVGNEIDVRVEGKVVAANDFVSFAEGQQFGGETFGSLVANPDIDISALISTNLRDANTFPTLAGDLNAYFSGLTESNTGDALYTAAQVAEIEGAIAVFEASAGIGGLFDRYIRTTSLDSAELRFEVPAPATLGLLGLGLLGLRSRMKKRA